MGEKLDREKARKLAAGHTIPGVRAVPLRYALDIKEQLLAALKELEEKDQLIAEMNPVMAFQQILKAMEDPIETDPDHFCFICEEFKEHSTSCGWYLANRWK